MMPFRRIAQTGAAVALATLASGCSASHAQPSAPARSTAPTATAAGSTASAADIPGFTTTLAKAGNRTGDAEFSTKQIKAGTIAVLAACTGHGAIHVNITSVIAFDVDCGEQLPTMNQIHLGSQRVNITTSVKSGTTGQWALTLAWHGGGGTMTPSPGAA